MTLNNAYVFPGQGSQTVGMMSGFARHLDHLRASFDTASARLGYDLWQLVQDGPEAQLNQTEYTQAAMLTADVAIFKLLQSLGAIKPQWMAGHSLGEYAALVCAESLGLEDAAWLVSQRGRIMQASVPTGQGAMGAIVGLTDEQVASICQKASDETTMVSPANYNAIGQVVIAGHTAAVDRALILAEQMDARLARLIPVSVPCHCPLLSQAADEFADCLLQINWRVPNVSVISNVDLSVYKTTADIQRLLKAQLYSPVRWVETIQLMKNNFVSCIIECGPGKVLTGLIKRIDNSIQTVTVCDDTALEQTFLFN